MQFLPSGNAVLGMFNRFSGRGSAFFAIIAVDTGQELHRSNFLPEYSEQTIISPDESFVACLTRTRIRIYPLRERFTEPLATLQTGTTLHFTDIAFHPSGKYLAATGNDRTVHFYDTKTWEIARTFTWQIGKMRSIAFSPDGATAAAGSDDRKVIIWDVDL